MDTDKTLSSIPLFMKVGGSVCLSAWFLLIYSGEIWGMSYENAAWAVVELALLSFGALFVTLIIIGLKPEALARLRGSRVYLMSVGLLMALGTVGIALRLNTPEPVYVLSCILVGCTGALFAVEAIRHLSFFSPRKIILYCSVILGLGILIYVFFLYAPRLVCVPVLCLLPIIATPFFFAGNDNEVFAPAPAPDEEGSLGPFSGWHTTLVLALFIFSGCIIRGYLPLSMDNNFFSFARSLAALFIFVEVAVIIALSSLLPAHFDFGRFIQGIMLLGVVLFIFVPVFGFNNYVVLALTDAYRAVCGLSAIVFFACVARKKSLLSLSGAVGSLACFTLLGLLGWLAGFLLNDRGLDSQSLTLASSLISTLAVLSFVLIYRRSESSLFLHQSEQEVLQEEAFLTLRKNENLKGSGRWRKRCEEVAKTYLLSSREQEVFILMAKGYRPHSIGEKLAISYNTTRAHIRNIYAKCGIHSQQEFIRLIDNAVYDQTNPDGAGTA